MHPPHDVLIVGAGAFGLSAACELAQRGLRVRVLDTSRLPNPRGASTDVSRIVRSEYGNDVHHTALVERCLPAWRALRDAAGRPLFHECGVLFLTSRAMREGTFEHASWNVGRRRQHALERLTDVDRARFECFPASRWRDGFFDGEAGYVHASRACRVFAERARARGAEILETREAVRLIEDNGRVRGVATRDGRAFHADVTILACGAWTTKLCPELEDRLEARAQPVFYLRPARPERFRPPAFPVWTADLAERGFYGFPADERGLVKIGHHGRGRLVDVDGPRALIRAEEDGLAAFLTEHLPELADAECVASRACIYTDSCDGDFLIDHHEDRPGLFLATGGSGHAFKFLPVLGDLIADRLLGVPNAEGERYAWREPVERREHARSATELMPRKETIALDDPHATWNHACHAITHGEFDTLRVLLDREPELATARGGVDPYEDWTLLHVAVEARSDALVDLLIDRGADLDAMAGALETTPLGLAAEQGDADLVTHLAERGAGVDGLRDAAALGRLDVIADPFPRTLEALAEQLSDEEGEHPDRTLHAAFQLACLGGREATARTLLELALADDPDLAESVDLEFGHAELLRFLLETRHLLISSPELLDTLGEWVQEHLSRADPANLLDVGTPDRDDHTAEELARAHGHSDLAAMLADRTPPAPRRVRPERLCRPHDDPETTLFLHACQRAHVHAIDTALERRPELIHARTPFGLTAAAMLASHRGADALEAFEILRARGLEDLRPILRMASWWGVSATVRWVLQHASFDGETLAREGLLPAAAATRHNGIGEPMDWWAILENLLDAGADPHATDAHGRTAYGFADETVRPRLVERGVPERTHHEGLRTFQDALLADDRRQVLERAAQDPRLLTVRDDRGNGCTPVLHAVLHDDVPFARELAALLPFPLELHDAVALADPDAMRAALERLGVPAIGAHFGSSPPGAPLHVAAWCGHLVLARELVERYGYSFASENDGGTTGVCIGPEPFHGATPFHLAARRGHEPVVAWFLDLMDVHRIG